MTKIEPMTLELLKEHIASWNETPESYAVEFEMALAWIEAEARARMRLSMMMCPDNATCRHVKIEDYIAAVKAEIGWVEDK